MHYDDGKATRRQFLKGTASVAAGFSFANSSLSAFAAGSSPSRLSRNVIACGTSLLARGTRASADNRLQAYWDGPLNWLYFLSGGRFIWHMRRAPAETSYRRGLSGFSFAVDASRLDSPNDNAPVTNFGGGRWVNPGIASRVEAMRAANAGILIFEGGTIDYAAALPAETVEASVRKIIGVEGEQGFLSGRKNASVLLCGTPPRDFLGYPNNPVYALDDPRRAESRKGDTMRMKLANDMSQIQFADVWSHWVDKTRERPYLPYAADGREPEGWLGYRATVDGLHNANDGAYLWARSMLPLILAMTPPPEQTYTRGDDYDAKSNPHGALNVNPALEGSGGAGNGVPGDIAEGYYVKPAKDAKHVICEAAKSGSGDRQVLRFSCEGKGKGVETFAFGVQETVSVPAKGSVISAWSDIKTVKGTRALHQMALRLVTRSESGVIERSEWGSSKQKTQREPFSALFPGSRDRMPDLSGVTGRLTSFELPVTGEVRRIELLLDFAFDASRKFEFEVEVQNLVVRSIKADRVF